ncbi:unnamed protein product [Brassicogethes aeneus]|uniref:C-type lectin domain-containing protein n=1 Tax=Brassicogethes aeneus TaxID=1431903 RepID=A0A9P0FJI6_BRAAE|nr:unnamed protein product [Brassicogethes aeneus]
MPIIGWKNVANLRDCMDFVKAVNYTRGYFKNCQALGCPETSNSSLEMDFGFDYYSAYDFSKIRTNQLSYFIKNQLTNWYKAAYVGLDDMYQEGLFENAFGSFLGCSRYRAWAPGHPRSKHKNEDCVILDSERTWRVIDCKIKLRAVCELFPHKPVAKLNGFQYKNVSCHKIRNKKKRKMCKEQKELWSLVSNSSRLDQCALVTYLLN